MRGDVVWRLEFLALTPFHIGDGSVWDPGDYIIEPRRKLAEWEKDEMDDDEIEEFERRQGASKLHRIDFAKILSKLPSQKRHKITKLLDRGDWKSAIAQIKNVVGKEDYEDTLILHDEYLASTLERLREDPRRYGEIRGFLRSGGRVIVPGSSLKGVFRTAYLTSLLEHRRDMIGNISSQIEERKTWIWNQKEPKRLLTSDLASTLENLTLTKKKQKNTDLDPFRYVRVSDASLPSGSTTIGHIPNYLPAPETGGRARTLDMNMYYELVESWATGTDGMRWEAEVRIEGRSGQQLRRRLAPNRAPEELEATNLWTALRTFGLRLWKDELKWFWNREPETSDLLNRAMRQFCIQQDQSCALIRIGRFSHFESKSVPDLRVNQHHRRAKQFRDHGETRMVVKRDGVLVPLGWVLVWLREVRVES